MKKSAVILLLSFIFSSCEDNSIEPDQRESTLSLQELKQEFNLNEIPLNSIDLSQAMTFSTVSDARIFLKEFENSRLHFSDPKEGVNILVGKSSLNGYNPDDEGLGIDIGGNKPITVSLDLGGNLTIWVTIGWTDTGQPQVLASGYGGTTLGVNWSQTANAAWAQIIPGTNGNVVEFEVQGLQQLVVIVEGIGVIHETPMEIHGTVNVENGVSNMTYGPLNNNN